MNQWIKQTIKAQKLNDKRIIQYCIELFVSISQVHVLLKVENEALVSTGDFRVQSAVSYMKDRNWNKI